MDKKTGNFRPACTDRPEVVWIVAGQPPVTGWAIKDQ